MIFFSKKIKKYLK